MKDKWSDPTYHVLESMRELSAAEIHLIQYIKKKDDKELNEILDKIRDFRKRMEENLLG